MNNISREKPIDYEKLSEGLCEARNSSLEMFSRSIRDQFNKKGKAMPSPNMSNTKKDHVGLIYQHVASHVMTHSCVHIDEKGASTMLIPSADEIAEKLCSAFEKLNDRVKEW